MFLAYLLAGKSPNTVRPEQDNHIRSIAQDMCYATLDGKWKTAKHTSIAITLHHLTGSAKLITLLNRYGHCCSYFYVLECETAWCEQILTNDEELPNGIVVNSNRTLHLCWDNWDLIEETASGAATTHSTHGILIQDFNECTIPSSSNDESDESHPCSTPRSKARRISFVPQPYPEFYCRGKVEPTLLTFKTAVANKQAVESANRSDTAWLLHRYRFKDDEEKLIPGWSAWVSQTSCASRAPVQPSTIAYLPPVLESITEFSTVKRVLDTSKEITAAANQKYVIVTFDLAAAKKAYDIVFENKQLYKNVFIRLGVFHLLGAYYAAIGKNDEWIRIPTYSYPIKCCSLWIYIESVERKTLQSLFTNPFPYG